MTSLRFLSPYSPHGMLMHRRDVIRAGVAAGVSAIAPALTAVPGADEIVRCPAGTLAGFQRGSVRHFRGIPFAQPPVGRLRFLPPRAASRWIGTRDATRFASAPMQQRQIVLNGAPRPTLAPGETMSEDCLYLNVWAPAAKGRFPVYLFVMGGGNIIGSTQTPIYDLQAIAAQGIVCVSPAYRLGAFGFLDLSSVLGADYAGSGNNGIRDLMLALEWTRDNIAAFGGDPEQITLGGISAGSTNVASLLAVPEARRLVVRALMMSGGQRVHRKPTATKLADLFVAAAGADKALRMMDANAILAGQARLLRNYPMRLPFRAVLDGITIRAMPEDALRDGAAAGLALMLTTTRDEMALRMGVVGDDSVTPQDLSYLTVERFAAVLERYRAAFPDVPLAELRRRALTAEVIWIATVRFAEAFLAGGGNPAYMARFDFSPRSGALANVAAHFSDAPFWIDRVDAPSFMEGVPDPDAPVLAAAMNQALAAFIKSGDPRAPGSSWPAYALDRRAVKVFDRVPHVVGDPEARERGLWTGVPLDHPT